MKRKKGKRKAKGPHDNPRVDILASVQDQAVVADEEVEMIQTKDDRWPWLVTTMTPVWG